MQRGLIRLILLAGAAGLLLLAVSGRSRGVRGTFPVLVAGAAGLVGAAMAMRFIRAPRQWSGPALAGAACSMAVLAWLGSGSGAMLQAGFALAALLAAIVLMVAHRPR